jgi:hypothetical protein
MRSAKLGPFVIFFLLSPALALSAKDTSDYPLKVEILWHHWERYNLSTNSQFPYFQYKVNGHGNITDGNTVHAFDFEYKGSENIASVPLGQTFLARWKKPQLQLEILMPNVGHEGKYFACDMETLVREGVYAGKGSGVHEISQADYQAGKLSPTTSKAAQPSAPSATTAKLSITSNPDSADISVDAEFMGTTPSVFQLSVGEHTIALQKPGYQVWQRKMKVVPGDITLNADLEPEKPK